ncbi:Uncharacterised protein [Mycobacteroides abscessus subsp. abscessus]|nr:Uncharacterised protein [Mycobacteroides abscessus subsp. abscessus]
MLVRAPSVNLYSNMFDGSNTLPAPSTTPPCRVFTESADCDNAPMSP